MHANGIKKLKHSYIYILYLSFNISNLLSRDQQDCIIKQTRIEVELVNLKYVLKYRLNVTEIHYKVSSTDTINLVLIYEIL